MSLSPGETLGPYKILASIGAGGMGEVYRARDPRLGRDVAIKVSGERFTERFDREARAVAALNHPNICTLYDVGPDYLVMELVEGESPRGPMPLDEALKIARQIGHALEAAHDKGIVHRDLKPGNIKVTPDGVVKVLDFGLAKLTEPVGACLQTGPTSVSNSPTLSMATQAGMILGTAAYMSPEQARGKPVDKRADIWAFGAVLYELLTGRKAFGGEDVTETMAKVIQSEPRWDGVPLSVQRLLKKCLEKDPKKRLRDIGDVWDLLDETPTSVPSRSNVGIVPWAVAWAFAVAFAVALWAPWRVARPAEQPLVRLDVDLGADVSLPAPGTGGSSVIISPDGTRLVYVSALSGPARLVTRRLDQPRATDLQGTEGASGPFFSPDGRWVGFFARGKLNKVPVEGGVVVPLGDNPISPRSASWGDDGNIVVAMGPGGLVRIPSSGGEATPLTEPAGGEDHLLPQVLPGGQAVLFIAVGGPGGIDTQRVEQRIEVITVRDRRRKTLVRAATSPRYLPSGHRSSQPGCGWEQSGVSGQVHATEPLPPRHRSVSPDRS